MEYYPASTRNPPRKMVKTINSMIDHIDVNAQRKAAECYAAFTFAKQNSASWTKQLLLLFSNIDVMVEMHLKGNYNFTEGEYHLANFLDRKLPKEWIIHTKPTLKKWGLHMTRKTPDIVIAHKKFGIMIIEVKDYSDFNNFKKEIVKTRNGKFLDIFYKDNKGRSKNINPVKNLKQTFIQK